jgi:hypothetical protein
MKKVNFYFLTLVVVTTLLAGCSDDETVASSTNGGGTNTGSLGDSTPTGKIDANSFHFLYDPAIPPVINSVSLAYTQQEVTISVFADDINDLRVEGQTVNFATEWGTWLDELDSCVITNGQCSVVWRSENPSTHPADCLVAITAWTTGEESFVDFNRNGQFDVTDTLFDLEEPYLDVNSNGAFDAAVFSLGGEPELIDIINFDGTTPGTANGSHDNGNNLYEGSRCAANNTARCSGRTSIMIHQRQNLLIQEPFTDSDDLDNDGDTTELIVRC